MFQRAFDLTVKVRLWYMYAVCMWMVCSVRCHTNGFTDTLNVFSSFFMSGAGPEVE